MPSKKTPPDTPRSTTPFRLDFTAHLAAIVTPEADGSYSIEVPALPGCGSAAYSFDDIEPSIVEATELWLAAMHERKAAEGEAGAPLIRK